MFKMSPSEVYSLVNRFSNEDSNYMSISYGVQIKIQEAILKFNEPGCRKTDQDLYDHLSEVCPKFLQWMSVQK